MSIKLCTFLVVIEMFICEVVASLTFSTLPLNFSRNMIYTTISGGKSEIFVALSKLTDSKISMDFNTDFRSASADGSAAKSYKGKKSFDIEVEPGEKLTISTKILEKNGLISLLDEIVDTGMGKKSYTVKKAFSLSTDSGPCQGYVSIAIMLRDEDADANFFKASPPSETPQRRRRTSINRSSISSNQSLSE